MSKRTRVAIDESKLQRVQRLLDARTAADAVDKALDQVLFEEEVMATLRAVAGKGKRITNVLAISTNILFDTTADSETEAGCRLSHRAPRLLRHP